MRIEKHMEKTLGLLVIDAQGGGIGRQLISSILQALPDTEITAVGTNSAATSAMLKAGAHRAATGENAVIVASRSADVIMGPIGIVIADSMLGEITPAMAAAVGQSPAARILIPFDRCTNIVAGVPDMSAAMLIKCAVSALLGFAQAS